VKTDDRYAPNWPQTAAIAHRATGGVCCWCTAAKSAEVHHAYYWENGRAIKGHEIPGHNVFPVCEKCHNQLHDAKLWAQVPDRYARTNTPSAIKTLRDNFRRLNRGL
jgi:hypothetical protein